VSASGRSGNRTCNPLPSPSGRITCVEHQRSANP
jgi:hypothetical protein